jgi:AraC family transcriptional regulator of adaptative response/methylated-DNA-[protein]-cysteine methyltransferase
LIAKDAKWGEGREGEGAKGESEDAKASGVEQMEIIYAIVDSALGLALIARTARGVCWLGLGDDGAQLEAELRRDRPGAALRRDDGALAAEAAAVRAYLAGDGPCAELPLDLQGTPFQRRVWAALRAIPYGETRTYGQIAAGLGLGPGAARAVGGAGAANPVSLLVPCHRAVGADGKLRGFRWQLERKRALLELERRGGSTTESTESTEGVGAVR